jgi:hypothetical protein
LRETWTCYSKLAKVILAGDFNAKHNTWHSGKNSPSGQTLLKHYNKNDYLIAAPVSPSHIPDNDPASADVLDLALLKNVLSHHTIKTLGFLSHSDHSPIMLKIRGPVQSDEPKTTYVYKEANWQYFKNLVNNSLNSKFLANKATPTEIDNAVTHLKDVLHETIRKLIPTKPGPSDQCK